MSRVTGHLDALVQISTQSSDSMLLKGWARSAVSTIFLLPSCSARRLRRKFTCSVIRWCRRCEARNTRKISRRCSGAGVYTNCSHLSESACVASVRRSENRLTDYSTVWRATSRLFSNLYASNGMMRSTQHGNRRGRVRQDGVDSFPAAVRKAEELREWCSKNPDTL